MLKNKVVKLSSRPSGFPSPDTWYNEVENVREINDGEVLLKNLYVSLDPAMRGWLNETRSYIPPVQIDEVMRAGLLEKF
jgi:NADPH-dependent curcumin reductase CurA